MSNAQSCSQCRTKYVHVAKPSLTRCSTDRKNVHRTNSRTAPFWKQETWTLTYCIWRILYYGDGTASPGGGTTTLGGGTAISGGGTPNTGGGTPFRLNLTTAKMSSKTCLTFCHYIFGMFPHHFKKVRSSKLW